MPELPPPSVQDIATSRRLHEYISAQINKSGGWIPFSSYMQLALYTPQLGYYNSARQKFGIDGDFVTAPELTPVFAQTMARQLAELLPYSDDTIYEFGAGSGALAVELILALEKLGAAPKLYRIIELSADLAARQLERIKQNIPHWLNKVEFLSELPDKINGIIIGNEVLDAIPCELICWQQDKILQRGVGIKNEQFIWQDRVLEDAHLLQLAQQINPDFSKNYISEINPIQHAFIKTLAQKLNQGALLFVDYGFPQHEYYHPQRSNGTLIGHYRQHSIHDPFYLPGLTDLTCHVDFTAIAKAGISAQLDLIGYTSQAQFLINCGITEVLAQAAKVNSYQYMQASSAVQKLLSNAEMGELFKIIAFSRHLPTAWQGFLNGDRCHTL